MEAATAVSEAVALRAEVAGLRAAADERDRLAAALTAMQAARAAEEVRRTSRVCKEGFLVWLVWYGLMAEGCVHGARYGRRNVRWQGMQGSQAKVCSRFKLNTASLVLVTLGKRVQVQPQTQPHVAFPSRCVMFCCAPCTFLPCTHMPPIINP